MNIGILGTGIVGQTIGTRLIELGQLPANFNAGKAGQ